jgi:AcrR family transcriptional regulator
MYDNGLVPTKQKTRERIKRKFLEMYKNRPLNKVRVSDLISTCDITRGTFYFHFPNMYALYRECERDMIDFMEVELSDIILSTVGRDSDKYIELVSNDMKRYIEHIDVIKCFLNGSEGSSFRQAWFDSIRQNYAKSMEFSYAMPPSKHDNLILFFAGGHLALLSNWVLADCKEPAEDVAYISAQVLFHGAFLQTIVKKKL